MPVLLFAAIALALTLFALPQGRALLHRLKRRGLAFPLALGALGVLLTLKGEPMMGGGLILGTLVWSGRNARRTNSAPSLVAPSLLHRLEEARALLGVDDHADRSGILAAHRRLITRYHPDTNGGSADLAGRINAARDLLLDNMMP